VVLIPFVLVPIVACLLLAPPILLGLAIGRDADGRMTTTATVAATVLACVLSAVAFVIGPRVSAHLARWRGDRVRPLLADPAPDPLG
jgi:hypothetical protein